MLTIAIVSVVDSYTSGNSGGGIFLLGLGLTFALVAVLPNPMGQMRWAWIPAAILGLMGGLILVTAEKLINYVWPLVLILVGIFLIYRSISRK
jgi:hypothetical protein